MGKKNSVLDTVLRELEAVGIKPTVTYGRHVKLSWIGPDGRERKMFTSTSPSHPTAPRMAKAKLRRVLRPDWRW